MAKDLAVGSMRQQIYIDNLYFKRVTPITMKSIPPSCPLKTKFITINYNNHDKKPIYNL